MFRKTLSFAIALSMLLGVGASVFADEVTTGTLVVNQVGAVGTVAVAGPSTASVTTASSTIDSAAVGSYTITVTAPTGFVLDSVKDGANVVLASPYTQTLAAGATVTYNVAFVAVPVTGALTVNQVGAVGTVAVAGPSTASITSASSTIAAAVVGSYTITITAPTGFVLDSVKDGASVLLASPYTQALAEGATVTYNVNYVVAPVPTVIGTLVVNQTGALGTVAVVGPSATSVTTATYSNASAAVGSYTITVTASTGFALDSVKGGAGTTLVSPYTQALAEGATVTYTVTYVAAPVIPPVTPTEITKQMIKDKTKLCAAMKGGKDKRACMKERNKMKHDFQHQEKAKREKAREEAKKKKEEERRLREEARKLDSDKDGAPDLKDAFPNDPKEWKDSDHDGVGDNAEKVAKKAAKDAIVAKVAECDKLTAGADKDTCLAALATIKQAFKDTYGQKSEKSDKGDKKDKGNRKGKKDKGHGDENNDD